MAGNAQKKSNYDKDNAIEDLIKRLANEKSYSKEKKSIDIGKVKNIYANNYEPSVTKISNIVVKILNDDLKKGEGLLVKLGSLKEEIDRSTNNVPKDIKSKFALLYENVNKEIGRYNLMSKMIDSKIEDRKNTDNTISVELQNRINGYEKVIKESQNIATLTRQELGRMENTFEQNSISSITSLTIFSAVILTLSGGAEFISGIYSGMAEGSKYRLVFTTATIGLVLFNLLYLLLFVVSKMTNKSIAFECNYYTEENGKCRCGSGYCHRNRHKPTLLCSMLNKYTYWFVPNIILVLIGYYDIYLYYIKYPEVFDVSEVTTVQKMSVIFFPLAVVAIFIIFILVGRLRQIIYQYKKCKVEILEKYIVVDEEIKRQRNWNNIIADVFKIIVNETTDTDNIKELIDNGDKLYKIKRRVSKEALKKLVNISEQRYIYVSEDVYNTIKILWYYYQLSHVVKEKRKNSKAGH